MKIIFFGTPDFAVASLSALVDSGFDVIAVVTTPDKPSGRGLKVYPTPVKIYADSKNIPTLQPKNLKDEGFIFDLQQLNADIHIVVAFRMLPEIVWNMPPMGTINVHGSLLPKYRGAAPINWAIINGDKETGVTTFKLKHEIDTGDILLQSAIPILDNDDVGTIHDKLMLEGAVLLVKTLNGLITNTIKEIPQDLSIATIHAPKIFREDTIIKWDNNAEYILNFIRGMSPYPGAMTDAIGKNIKIYKAALGKKTDKDAGQFENDNKSLRIAANDYWVEILEIQQEGKKRMDIKSFLCGFNLVS